jgi:hypothetical protein
MPGRIERYQPLEQIRFDREFLPTIGLLRIQRFRLVRMAAPQDLGRGSLDRKECYER